MIDGTLEFHHPHAPPKATLKIKVAKVSESLR